MSQKDKAAMRRESRAASKKIDQTDDVEEAVIQTKKSKKSWVQSKEWKMKHMYLNLKFNKLNLF